MNNIFSNLTQQNPPQTGINMPEIVMIVSIVSVILITVILYFGLSIYHVGKNKVMILERKSQYFETLKSGWHFYWAIVYKNAGIYKINNSKIIKIHEQKYQIDYQIIDAKTYHYSYQNIDEYIKKITLYNEKVNFDFLSENLTKIGIKLISINSKN